MNAVGIGEAHEEIIACSMTPRPPQERCMTAAQMIGPTQQFGAVRDALAYVINRWLALREHERMMVGVAA